MKDPVRFEMGDIVENSRGHIGKVVGIEIETFYEIRTIDKEKSQGYDCWAIRDEYGEGKNSLGDPNTTKVERAKLIEKGIKRRKVKSRFEILNLGERECVKKLHVNKEGKRL